MAKKWSSEALPWLGAGAVLGLTMWWSAAQTPRNSLRNVYGSRADCERDYNYSQCEQRSHVGGGYYGPYYTSSQRTANDPGPGRTAQNGRSQTAFSQEVSRGGFGATARGRSGYSG